MPIVVTADCQTYWRYRVHTLKAGTVVRGVEFGAHLRAVGAPVVDQADDSADADGDGVPDGPGAAVLAWVGDDSDRAREALAAETGRDKPRSGLVASLQKLIPADQLAQD